MQDAICELSLNECENANNDPFISRFKSVKLLSNQPKRQADITKEVFVSLKTFLWHVRYETFQ